jgi:dTDP-4-dehydrorhamnose reductase
MKVMIFGPRGYLGQQFRTIYPDAATPALDIADARAVRDALEGHRPDVVINCAGRCGTPNVDWCEDHKQETVHANVLGPLVLLEECARRGAFLVHLSSGCIYSGDNGGAGFTEADPPNFAGSFYSRSKAWADQILMEFPVLALRLRMPFDGSTSDRNLIMKLRKYRRVLTTPNSLTHLPDFLRAADALIRQRATGVYNVVNPGAISPFEVMTMYRELVDPAHEFEPLQEDRLGEVVKAGRSNCLLSIDRLEERGIEMPPVRRAVEAALRSLGKALATGARR